MWRILLSLLILLPLPCVARLDVAVRRFDTGSGLSHVRVRDIMQDSLGYIWLATWIGIDRFDGCEFRHYTTYPGDDVTLDNHRIERLAACEGGRIALRTYTGRVYGLDPVAGTFSAGTAADSAALAAPRRPRMPRPELSGFDPDSPLTFVDADGNMWIGRDEGIDFVSARGGPFERVDIEPLSYAGRDIHAIHADAGGRIWAASRDGRVMIFDSSGCRLGNLTSDGRLVADSTAVFGPQVYAFASDGRGRVWIGTKSDVLAVLIPRAGGNFMVDRYEVGSRPGDLRCANVYAFAEDAAGNMWLGTFGGGVARATEDDSGRLIFDFPAEYPYSVAHAARVRRLAPTRSGLMVAATTGGIVTFDPAGGPMHYTGSDHRSASSLSNDDILDVLPARDGAVYFAAFSGGIDRVDRDSCLLADAPVFDHLNIRNGLAVDHVLSVSQDRGGDFRVVSTDALVRYDSLWRQVAVYDSRNIGFDVRFTEARPAMLPDGTLVYGLRRGLLLERPQAVISTPMPRLAVTAVETASGTVFGMPGPTIALPRGSRDVTVHFAALDFAGASAIRYSFRVDDGEWSAASSDRSVRLSSLPSGTSVLQIRHTDAFGTWCDTPVSIPVEVPCSLREVAEAVVLALGAVFLAGAVILYVRGRMKRHTMAQRLEHCIRIALDGGQGDTSTSAAVARAVGETYGDEHLKVEALARRLDVSRSSLRHDVKAELGVSVEDFVRLVRVRAVARLLESTGLTVSEAAYRCGFRTPQYMAMVFKEQTGVTPTEYAARRRK